jgi:Tfp pilus assembly protein PilF
VLLLALACGACSSMAPGPRGESTDPDVRLAKVLDELARARRSGPDNGANLDREIVIVDSGAIQNDLQHLTLEFPMHAPTLLANAVVAWEAHDPARSQAYLDRVLAIDGANIDAVLLRVRIAVAEGNVPFARRLLDRHVRQSPDSAELRETLASVLYLQDDYVAAAAALVVAERLGAPDWRVHFNRGLIAEAAGETEEARRLYSRAFAENPSCSAAKARAAGLAGG